MSGDKLVGDVLEVGADNMGLRTDPKNVVADALNLRRFPARRDGAERVPSVAGIMQSSEGLTPSSFST